MNTGPQIAQQRLTVLNNHVETLTSELEALAAKRRLSDHDIRKSPARRGSETSIENGAQSRAKGWPGTAGSSRTPGTGGHKSGDSRDEKSSAEPAAPPIAANVYPDPEIFTEFDRIARQHLLIWLAICLAMLCIDIGLPYAMLQI